MRTQPLPDFVTADMDLAGRTTLALPGRAACFAEISSCGQLAQLACLQSPRRFVLGGGSNVVLSGDFDGLLLQMAIAGRELLGEDAAERLLRPDLGFNSGGGWEA